MSVTCYPSPSRSFRRACAARRATQPSCAMSPSFSQLAAALSGKTELDCKAATPPKHTWAIWDENDPGPIPSPASLRSAPSPAVRERGYNAFSSELLSRIAGEGGPSPKGLVGEGHFLNHLPSSCSWQLGEAANRPSGPPHPALSLRPAGGEGTGTVAAKPRRQTFAKVARR
jgi:hypothetical protein